MLIAWLMKFFGVERYVITMVAVAAGIVAVIGVGATWNYKVKQAAIAEYKAKEATNALKRAEEAIRKSREFQRDVDDGADIDCLLFKRGWLTGPVPVSCK